MAQPRIVEARPLPGIAKEGQDFSLVLGGPLYQLYLRIGLALPALELVARRIVVISSICWLPLLLLSTLEGHLTGGVRDPFLLDPEVHVRFLFALPLLISSEVLVHQRMRQVVEQFTERDLIAPKDRARFHEILESAMRLRNSVTAEFGLLILVSTFGYWFWRNKVTLTVSSWYALPFGDGIHLTAAGVCYSLFSLTIFRFILFRWYFRLFIWYRFLWQVRRLPLQFNLFHPDRSGGIGFLAGSIMAFSPVIVAQTSLLSSIVFARILYMGETLPEYKMEIAGLLIFCILLVILPLTFFADQLEGVGRAARYQFGSLSSHYVTDFRHKWMNGTARSEEPLLGTSDIQSLADLANSYAVAAETRLIPVTKQVLVRFLILAVFPLLPLVLTMIPLSEIAKSLFKLAF